MATRMPRQREVGDGGSRVALLAQRRWHGLFRCFARASGRAPSTQCDRPCGCLSRCFSQAAARLLRRRASTRRVRSLGLRRRTAPPSAWICPFLTSSLPRLAPACATPGWQSTTSPSLLYTWSPTSRGSPRPCTPSRRNDNFCVHQVDASIFFLYEMFRNRLSVGAALPAGSGPWSGDQQLQE
jgi:hypothetical protein